MSTPRDAGQAGEGRSEGGAGTHAAGHGAGSFGVGCIETGSLHPTNSRNSIDTAESAILDALVRRGYDEASRFAIRLALEEGLVNAFLHGHRGLAAETPVNLRYTVADEFVEIAITDQGPGYDPSTVADPTLDENLELPSGRGLMLIRAYMNGGVRHEDNGSTIVMRFERQRAG